MLSQGREARALPGRKSAALLKPSSLLVIAALVTAPIAHATQVKLFRTSTQEDFLSGVLDSISVDNLGALRLAQKAEKVTSVDEPFLFAACAYGDGWVVGTGNAGKVVHVAADGSSTVLFETTEPEVFAIWADDDGTVYAGSSPNGKVYRWANEELTEFLRSNPAFILVRRRARGPPHNTRESGCASKMTLS